MNLIYQKTAAPVGSLFKFIADPTYGIINNLDCEFAGRDLK